MSAAQTSLIELLRRRQVLVLDGAMGTELDRRGSTGRCACNLSDPDAVVDVHRDYLCAGAGAVITNTLTMNRVFVESHGLGIDVPAANRAGAALARRAAGRKAYVLGNLSSTGQMLEPYGTWSEARFLEAFREQSGLLAEGGVDGFIVETMFDLREAVCALRACRAVSTLPVIVCIAYNTAKEGGRTVMGNSAAECARVLEGEGASAIGANCGNIGPGEMAEIVGTLSSLTRLPIAAEPNAGMPKLVDGRTVFDMDPGAFAAGLKKCREAGATVLGGCCGTTPAHIRTFVETLGEAGETLEQALARDLLE